MIEKRFQQTKTVPEIAPVFLKNEGRIEALFTLYFLALLVQALIERELRLNDEAGADRRCTRPTTEQVLRLFSLVERHVLLQDGRPVQVFDAERPTCSSRSYPSSVSRSGTSDPQRSGH